MNIDAYVRTAYQNGYAAGRRRAVRESAGESPTTPQNCVCRLTFDIGTAQAMWQQYVVGLMQQAVECCPDSEAAKAALTAEHPFAHWLDAAPEGRL